jgi:uncharacterized protein (TIRG00374 family)
MPDVFPGIDVGSSNAGPAPSGLRQRLRDVTEPVPRARMLRGLIGFAVLTAAGLLTLYWLTPRGRAGEVPASLSAGFLLLALLSGGSDLLIDALRYQIFVRRIRPGTSIWLSVRTELANRFMGAITPSQAGGGPAQVFILWRGGIPVPDTLSFMLINFLSTLVFFLVAGGLSAWMFRNRFPAGGVHLLIEYGFLTFGACLVLILAVTLRPDWVARGTAAFAHRMKGRPSPAARMLHRVFASVTGVLERYRTACVRFIREHPLLPLVSFALTVALYLNKFTLGWLLVRGLGIHAGYVPTLAVQALLTFILYVAPSPGGSGIGELSTGAIMTVLLPTYLLAPFTLAYRLITLYLPAAGGSVVMLRALAPAAGNAAPPAADAAR